MQAKKILEKNGNKKDIQLWSRWKLDQENPNDLSSIDKVPSLKLRHFLTFLDDHCRPDCYVTQMRPIKAETAVHRCACLG